MSMMHQLTNLTERLSSSVLTKMNFSKPGTKMNFPRGGGGVRGYTSISLTGMLVREQISTTQKIE